MGSALGHTSVPCVTIISIIFPVTVHDSHAVPHTPPHPRNYSGHFLPG